VAIVSNIGETRVNVIYPANCQNEAQATGEMALLGHEAELHNYSLELLASQNTQLAIPEQLKQKYDQGKIRKLICPKCVRKFEGYTRGVLQSDEAL